MKKYNDYIYEGLNGQEFIDSYNMISSELTAFWKNLKTDIANISNNNSTVSGTTTATTVNPEKSETKNDKFTPPVKGEIYNYNTQTGKVETVKILVPDNGQNTNTAIVQNINKPGKMGQHTANWTRLAPKSKTI